MTEKETPEITSPEELDSYLEEAFRTPHVAFEEVSAYLKHDHPKMRAVAKLWSYIEWCHALLPEFTCDRHYREWDYSYPIELGIFKDLWSKDYDALIQICEEHGFKDIRDRAEWWSIFYDFRSRYGDWAFPRIDGVEPGYQARNWS